MQKIKLFEEPVLKTYKWSSALIRLIFQMLLCWCLCLRWGGQSKAKDVDCQARALLKSALFSLACLWRAEASLSGLSQPSTAHSLLIYQSLSLLLSSANYSWAPATAACLIWRCTGLALMSLSTRKSRGQSLNRAEGDYVTACLWGWNIFILYMYV